MEDKDMGNRRVLEMIPLLGNGGMERIVYAWLEVLRRERGRKIHFDVVTVSVLDERMSMEFKRLGCHVFIVPLRQRHVLRRYVTFRRIMKEGRYDAVHLHTSCAMDFSFLLAAKSCGISIRIAHSHNSDIGNPNWANQVMQKVAFPVFNRLCTKRLACSRLAGDHLFGGYPYELFRNSIDTAKFQFDIRARMRIREKYGIGNDDLVVGHVGNFLYAKNHRTVIEVFSEIEKLVPNARLILVGSGALEDEIRGLVSKHGMENRVIYAGNVRNAEEYYCAMDVFFLPSHHEGFSLAAIEAQCNGLPCVIAEHLSKDMVITDRAYRMSLDESARKWALLLVRVSRECRGGREEYSQVVRNKGFDIESSGCLLGEYYDSAEP